MNNLLFLSLQCSRKGNQSVTSDTIKAGTTSCEHEVETMCTEPGFEQQQGGSSRAGWSSEAGPGGAGRNCSAKGVHECIPGNERTCDVAREGRVIEQSDEEQYEGL